MNIFTDRLCLREFVAEDYDFFFELETSEFIQKFESDTIPTKEEIDEKFSKILKCINKIPRNRYYLVITKLPDYQPVGKLGFWEIDPSIREWEIGWDIHIDHIGKGYAPEAAKALMKFGFNKLNAHRIQALCNDKNTNSEKVMMKIGMKKEETCRAVRLLNNNWYGSHIYSLLDTEIKYIDK